MQAINDRTWWHKRWKLQMRPGCSCLPQGPKGGKRGESAGRYLYPWSISIIYICMYSYIYIATYVDLYVLSMSVSMLCTHFLLYKINVIDCICDIIYAFITTHIFACTHDTLDCHSDGRLEQSQTITHIYIYNCSQLDESQLLDIGVRHKNSCSQIYAKSTYTAGDGGDNTACDIQYIDSSHYHNNNKTNLKKPKCGRVKTWYTCVIHSIMGIQTSWHIPLKNNDHRPRTGYTIQLLATCCSFARSLPCPSQATLVTEQ